jgi:uracil-DNA glycosylase
MQLPSNPVVILARHPTSPSDGFAVVFHALGMNMKVDLPKSWMEVLAPEFAQPYWTELAAFVDKERRRTEVFPPEEEVFSAFLATPYDRANVLILGQDPYHDVNQSHGMCFSVKPGIRTPPSLVNIYKELATDIPGFERPGHGYLMPWAEQGVLLLNAVLTVRAHEANSHKGRGWEQFTDAVIRSLNDRDQPVVFVLWGGYAKKKAGLIDGKRHTVIAAAHPSPLSARHWWGNRSFSRINAALAGAGLTEIDWDL